MDWWAGVNLCGSGSSAAAELGLNPMDSTIFDPWIQCDELDLGTILHQASTVVNSNSSSSTSSPASNSSLSSSSACSPTSSVSTSTSKSPSRAGSPRVITCTSGAPTLLVHPATSVVGTRRYQSSSNTASANSLTVSTGRASSGSFFCSLADHGPQLQPEVQPQLINGETFTHNQSRLTNQLVHHRSTNNHGSPIPASLEGSMCSSLNPFSSNGHCNRPNNEDSLTAVHSSPAYAVQQSHLNQHCNLDNLLSNNIYHRANVLVESHCCPHNNQDNQCATFMDESQTHMNQLATNHNHDQQQEQQQQQQQHHHHHQQQHQHQHTQLLNNHIEQQLDQNQLHQTNLARPAGSSTAMSDLQCNEVTNANRLGHMQDSGDIIDSKSELQSLLDTSESTSDLTSCAQNSSSAESLPIKSRLHQPQAFDLVRFNQQESRTRGTGRQTSIVKQVAGSSTSLTNISGGTVQKTRRCRHITDYVLAEEEKRLLIKEGYTDFPMTCQARPLSKSEERILRKIRRKIRNKKSAQCSRQRKKEYVEDLERKYAAVVRENGELKDIIERIQEQHQQSNQHHHQCNMFVV